MTTPGPIEPSFSPSADGANGPEAMSLHRLVGADGERIHWSRIITVGVALFFCTSLTSLFDGWLGNPDYFTELPRVFFVRMGIYPLLFPAVILLVFRFIRRGAIAATVATLLYLILARSIELSLGLHASIPWVRLAWNFLNGFISLWCFLIALLYLLPKTRPLWLALGLGSLSSAVVAEVLQRLVRRLSGSYPGSSLLYPPSEELASLALSLVDAATFAYLIWTAWAVVFAPTKRMSKGFFVGSLIAGPVLALATTGVGVYRFTSRNYSDLMLTPYTSISLLLWILWVVVLLILIHKMWSAIQDGHARTTPRRAVGFLFIPIFSFYWVFPAVWGFAQDYNRHIAHRQLNLRRLPEGLFLAFAIIAVVSWIPMLLAVNLIISPIMAAKTCDAVNRLQDSGPQG
jgi:hypothetical protein